MLKRIGVVLISLMAMFGRADAQNTVRRAGIEDMKYKVGTFYRPSRLVPGDSISLHGFTPINVLAFGVDNTGATDCADSLQAAVDSVIAWGGGSLYLPSGTYLLGSKIQVTTAYSDTAGVFIVGDGQGSTKLKANADGMTIVHWSGNFGGIEGIGLFGNSHTTVVGLKIAPEDEAQTTTLVHQDYNRFRRMMIQDCADGLVMRAGPYVGTSVSGCYFNTFDAIDIFDCTRGIYMQDPVNLNGSGVNRNQFVGVRIGAGGGTMNTGLEIESGGTNTFFGCSFEDISDGTTPNTIPTAVQIYYVAPTGKRGNGNNMFFGTVFESNTRDLDNRITSTEFYGSSIAGSKVTIGGAAVWPNVMLSAQATTAPTHYKLSQYNTAQNDSVGIPQIYVKGSVVPSTSPGFHASTGSLLLHTGGYPYFKATSDTTRWNRVGTDDYRVNVNNYGAIGDGTTNNATTVLAAKNAAQAIGSPAVLYFPASADTFYVSSAAIDSLDVVADGPNIPWNITGGAARMMRGTKSPEGKYAAPIGSIYQKTNGGNNERVFVKVSSGGVNGWRGLLDTYTGVDLEGEFDGSVISDSLVVSGTRIFSGAASVDSLVAGKPGATNGSLFLRIDADTTLFTWMGSGWVQVAP